LLRAGLQKDIAQLNFVIERGRLRVPQEKITAARTAESETGATNKQADKR
jgi:hypothetical protein